MTPPGKCVPAGGEHVGAIGYDPNAAHAPAASYQGIALNLDPAPLRGSFLKD
eukprot:gene47102-12398_t